jgi:hypothetical protein
MTTIIYLCNRLERSLDVSYAAFTSAFEGLPGRVDKPAGAIAYVFGNALIAFEMTKHDPRASLYVRFVCSRETSGQSACS